MLKTNLTKFVLIACTMMLCFCVSAQNTDLNSLEKLAKKGDLTAMCELADNYYSLGEYKKAAKYYKSAGDKGVASAKRQYGVMLLNGKGINRNKGGALKWIKQAALEGDPDAMMYMSDFYRDGLEGYEMFLGSESTTPSSYKVFVKRDSKVSDEWLDKALEAGSPRAIKQRLKSISSIEEKVPLWEKAAAAGDQESISELAKYYSADNNWNYEKALGYASQLKDNSKVLSELNQKKEARDKFNQEVEALKNKAASGDATAMYELSQKLWNSAPAEAAEWALKSAQAGNSEAMNSIGFCYMKGYGVKTNYTEAINWFKKGAAAGNISTMCWLGNMYYEGIGVEKNIATAIQWYEKAVDKGANYGNANRRIADYRKAENNAKAVAGSWTLKINGRSAAVYTFRNDHTYTAKYTNFLCYSSGCYWSFTETGKWSLSGSGDIVYLSPKSFTKPAVKVGPSASYDQRKMPSVVAAMNQNEYSRFLKEHVSYSDRDVLKIISTSKMEVKSPHATESYDNTWGELTKTSGSSSASSKKSTRKR